jgi:hypothetical protein
MNIWDVVHLVIAAHEHLFLNKARISSAWKKADDAMERARWQNLANPALPLLNAAMLLEEAYAEFDAEFRRDTLSDKVEQVALLDACWRTRLTAARCHLKAGTKYPLSDPFQMFEQDFESVKWACTYKYDYNRFASPGERFERVEMPNLTALEKLADSKKEFDLERVELEDLASSL